MNADATAGLKSDFVTKTIARGMLLPFVLLHYVLWEWPRSHARRYAAERRLRSSEPRYLFGYRRGRTGNTWAA